MEMAATPTGILKKPIRRSFTPNERNENRMGSPTSHLNGVHWRVPSNFEELLRRAASKNGADKATFDELEGLLTHLRHQKGPALIDLLHKIQQNVSVLKPRLESFVLAVLRIGWADQEKPVVVAFRDFLMNLVTAQLYYTKPVVKMLMCNLLGVANGSAINAAAAPDMKLNLDAIEKEVFENTHETLKVMLKLTPLAGKSALLQYARECSPYAMTCDVRAHTNYVANILEVSLYTSPEDRLALLTSVVERLVLLDAHIDKESPMSRKQESDDEEEGKTPRGCAKANLDSGMEELVRHIDRQVEGDDLEGNRVNLTFWDFVKVFGTHVLPAHTGHVQFALFYLFGKRPALTRHFLQWLWRKFTCPNTPSVIRQATMSYLSSLVCRAAYIGTAVLMEYLGRISGWIHSYINSSSAATSTVVTSSSAICSHGPFYAACQALFCMFNFRHEELVASNKRLAFVRSLSLNTIVTCRLNPLYVCLPQVVNNFSAIARSYQLAYCSTIIQRNSRISIPIVSNVLSSAKTSSTSSILDAFFPFDPYELPHSKRHFSPFYREHTYTTIQEDVLDHEESKGEKHGRDEVEDFLTELEENTLVGPKDKRRRNDSTVSSESFEFGY